MTGKFYIGLTLVSIFAFFFLLFGLFHRLKISPSKTSDALAALTFLSAQRTYPNDTIPNAAHYAAFEYSYQNLKSGISSTISVEPWRTIGPHNIGGRTLTIAFNPQNPNTIYAGSASGGLWKTKSAGIGPDAWNYVSTGFPVLGVSSIAITPEDSNTIYIGTGEVYSYQNSSGGISVRETRGSYGIGILKTTDGGVSWSKSLDWSYHQQRGIQVVKLNPQNSSIIWAGTTEGTYKSTDAGVSWSRVNSTIMVTDLAINPDDTNIVFIACGNFESTGHGIYRTTDGGSSWIKLTQGLPSTFGGKAHLSIYPSYPSIIFASIGNGHTGGAGSWLCRSDNNGDSWTIVSIEDYASFQGWFSHDVCVHPSDSNIVFAVGLDIWKSTSGGTNLVRKSDRTVKYWGRIPAGGNEGPPEYSHADHHDLVFHPFNPDIIYFATDGGIFRTTDGGETFEGRNGGYQTTQFYPGFSSSPLDSTFALGGKQDNGTSIYDGQLAWIKALNADGSWSAINSSNDTVIYASWQRLTIQKSTDRGLNWSNISPPLGGTSGFIAPYVLGINDPEVIYAGRSHVYKSTNGGITWRLTNSNLELDGNPVLSIAVSYSNSDVVYATTAPVSVRAGIFRTTNGGLIWENITGTVPDRYPVDVAVDPNDDSIVYVVFSGFGSSHLFKSSDGGNNWFDIGVSLPDIPTSAIAIDPDFPDHLYIGNDIGVYVSIDGGNSWATFQEGLPDAVIVMDLSVSPLNRKLRVATHGNGVYERELLEGVVPITESDIVILDFALEQNYPNPFNPQTIISYSIAETAPVSLQIYNSLGQEIRTLVKNQIRNPGKYQVIWDGRNNSGKKVSSGIYIYRLQVRNFVASKRMLLAK